MIEEDVLEPGREHQPSDGFHGFKRAPRASRPVIVVTYEGPMPPNMTIDIGLGEPDQEHVVLCIGRRGEFPFPQNVSAGERVSVRSRGIPPGPEVRVSVRWGSPAVDRRCPSPR